MHNRSARVLVTTLLILFTISMSLEARILKQKKRGCLDGGVETFTLFEDDCTGGIYTLYVDCLGNTYFNVPEPQWKVTLLRFDPALDPFPDQFWEMVRMADFKTPGALTGIYLIDDHGERVNFRNPYDEAEAALYLQNCSSHGIN